MNQAIFRFYAELNDFLPFDRRYKSFTLQFNDRQSVKHLIESLGVPHTEVDLILVNGISVAFNYLPHNCDKISVFPVFESVDISPINQLRPEPLREVRFVLDGHLGRLAAYLRILGFDSQYQNDYSDEELTRITISQKRILLTHDRGLLKRKLILHGYYVHSSDPRRQMVEVIHRFDLSDRIIAFNRCVHCNQELVRVKKEEISEMLMPDTRRYFSKFKQCPGCKKVYWKGSHYQQMVKLIDWVKKNLDSERKV
jgi:uncharacterized protein with PIN domain